MQAMNPGTLKRGKIELV